MLPPNRLLAQAIVNNDEEPNTTSKIDITGEALTLNKSIIKAITPNLGTVNNDSIISKAEAVGEALTPNKPYTASGCKQHYSKLKKVTTPNPETVNNKRSRPWKPLINRIITTNPNAALKDNNINKGRPKPLGT